MPSNFLRARRAAAAALALAPAAFGQSSPLIMTGDSLPGLGNVSKVGHATVNDDGHWIATVRTTTGAVAVLRDGVVILKTGDPLGTSGAIYGFGEEFTSTNLNANLESAFTSYGSGVYFGATPLLTDAAPPPAPFSPGSTYLHFEDSKLNDARQVLASITVSDPATTGLTDDAMMLLQTDSAGALVSTTVLAKQDDLIPGLPAGINDVADTRRGFDLNASGDALYHVETLSSVNAILLNGSVLVKSGDQSPTFGSTYTTVWDSVALGDGGQYAFLASYGLGQGLVYGGAEVAKTGKPMPGLPQFELESFGARFLDIDANGRLLWFADWDDPDDTRDTGILRDHELLVQEGVSLAGDQIVSSLTGDFGISGNGRFLVYMATRADGSFGAFVLDLLGGVTPFFGCAPNPGVLSVFGTPKPGSALTVQMTQPQSDQASGFVAFSASYATSPGACGILVPGIGEVLVGAPFLTLATSPVIPPIGAFASASIPDELGLLGATVHLQGAFLDLAGVTPAEPVRLTDAATVLLGL